MKKKHDPTLTKTGIRRLPLTPADIAANLRKSSQLVQKAIQHDAGGSGTLRG